MEHRIIPAIMSGGAGTRLWPISTDAQPKQFHRLSQPASLFVETIRRVQGKHGALSFAPPIALCNIAHADLAEAHLAEAGASASAIVLEPAPRNTAPVAAIAAALAAEIEPGALVLLLPADHIVADVAAFHAAIARAAPLANERIITFGIKPQRPATGFGYIKRGAQIGEGAYEIAAFREKPNAETAAAYLADGGYSWNAGMFLFSPRRLLEEFSASPAIRDGALAALQHGVREGARVTLHAEHFNTVPAEPFDIAVMEKTRRGGVVPCDIGWADVGSWDEIWRLAPKDAAGNSCVGPAAALDGANNLLYADGVKICAAGVNDLIIVATKEAIIVLPRERAQDVKALREAGLNLARGGA